VSELDEDDPEDVGVFRGVVLEGSTTVETVPEPPPAPAQPPAEPS
jgi:hypothetical protein